MGVRPKAIVWYVQLQRGNDQSLSADGINGGTNANRNTSAVVGNTTAFDRSSNKLYERALQVESRSHLYEPFRDEPQGG